MAFTRIAKNYLKLGGFIGSGSSGIEHTDEIYDIYGSKGYWNKNFPLGVYSFNAKSLHTYYSGQYYGFTGTIDPENCKAEGTRYEGTWQAFSVSEDYKKVTIRVSFTNTTGSPVELNSIAIIQNGYVWSSSGSSGSSNSRAIIWVYDNISSPITIPANDSVFVDITLEDGDVSSVSQG